MHWTRPAWHVLTTRSRVQCTWNALVLTITASVSLFRVRVQRGDTNWPPIGHRSVRGAGGGRRLEHCSLPVHVLLVVRRRPEPAPSAARVHDRDANHAVAIAVGAERVG